MTQPIEHLRGLLLPRLRQALGRIQDRFPDVETELLDCTVGSHTSYQGYHLGIDCDLVLSRPPTSLTLEVSMCHTRSAEPQIDCAHVVWGQPYGDIEAELFADPVGYTDHTAAEVSQGLDELLVRLEAALERGAPVQ